MSKITIITVFFVVCFVLEPSGLLAVNQINLLGVESYMSGAGPDFYSGTMASSQSGSFIPAKSDGEVVTFSLVNGESEDYLPSDSGSGFDPLLDSADFRNFASADIVDDGIVQKKDVNGGTCFGISYFTSIYYSRIIRPILQGGDPNLFRQFDINITLWDGVKQQWDEVFNNGETYNPGGYVDGVDYFVKQTWDEPGLGANELFWSFDNMKEVTDKYRLRSMSSLYDHHIKVAAIAHHDDQHHAARNFINAADPLWLSAGISQLEDMIDERGVQVFFFRRYKPVAFGLWYEVDWGHACMLYKVSKVKLESSLGDTREALRFHFYDPNRVYSASMLDDDGGSSLFYFPDSMQATFSEKVKSIYSDLQADSSVIDSLICRFGYYDIYEGHPVQDKIAKDAFLKSYVGLGEMITKAQKEEANEQGYVDINN